MKKSLLFIVAVLFAVAGFSQKTKIKDNIAYVDEVAYCKWDFRAAGNEVSISGMNATQEEIFGMWLDYSDPTLVSKSNPEGKVRWIELNFLTLGKKCEIDTRMQQGLLKFLYENKIYADGVLNAANVDIIISKYGMRFSENRPSKNVNIYINE